MHDKCKEFIANICSNYVAGCSMYILNKKTSTSQDKYSNLEQSFWQHHNLVKSPIDKLAHIQDQINTGGINDILKAQFFYLK